MVPSPKGHSRMLRNVGKWHFSGLAGPHVEQRWQWEQDAACMGQDGSVSNWGTLL